MSIHRTDVLILGSGLAGLATALKLAQSRRVTILTKEKTPDTNTAMAQGGIAAVMSDEDSFEDHIRDTLVAGAGLCNPAVVREMIEQAPDRIQDLVDWGVHFDLRPGLTGSPESKDLTREGGHRFRRILHFADSTGAEIHRSLLARVREQPNIEIRENHFAIDLILNKQIDPADMGAARVVGAYVLNKVTSQVETFVAPVTVLATGGAGKVYLYTSNWSGATGDGIAMAYRAGARIADLEFMQFHPTCLYHREARNFLMTEALRGEGGELVDAAGNTFMKKYHAMGSLAPRDIVARSIDAEMKKTGAACMFIDMTHRPAEFLRKRFPAIDARCREFGIDLCTQPIPVVPAAHYLCGGVVTDAKGRTDLEGLWAVGETACTGLHGANRLASNSLLEAMAMAHGASQQIQTLVESAGPSCDPPDWVSPVQTDADEMIVIHHMWEEIRRLMWNYVGIVRSDKRLLRARHRLQNILEEVKEYYSNLPVSNDILELRNIAIVASLTVECALHRRESRGIHFSLDCPPSSGDADQMKPARDTILSKGAIPLA